MKTTKGHSDTLISPIFSPGILLDAADLQQGVIYTQELMHLIMRHLFSPGVVCGLDIRDLNEVKGCLGKYKFTLSAGLALDDCGRPIHVPTEISVEAELNSNSTYGIFIKYQAGASGCKEAYATSDGTSESVATRKKEGYEIEIEIDSAPQNAANTTSCSKNANEVRIQIGKINHYLLDGSFAAPSAQINEKLCPGNKQLAATAQASTPGASAPGPAPQ